MTGCARGADAKAWLARAALVLFLGALVTAAKSRIEGPNPEAGRIGTHAPGEDSDMGDRAGRVHRDPLEELAARLRVHVETLATPSGRSWRHPEALAAAARHIQSFWEAHGYRVERQPIPGLGAGFVNLLAFGGQKSWEGSPLLVAAHYDAVEGTPGADDNASGVAVLLEVSRLLAAQRAASRPAVFAALTLEEPPFFGTDQQGGWVLARSLRRAKVALEGALVLEMVGYYRQEPRTQHYVFPLGLLGYPNRGDFVGLVANRRSRRLLGPLGNAIEQAGLPVETLAVPGRGRLLPPVRLSDHAAFWDQGYRGVMVTDTAFFRNPHYHGPGDVPETLDYVSMARLTQGLLRFLKR